VGRPQLDRNWIPNSTPIRLRLEPPEVADLEEEAALGLDEARPGDVFLPVPLDSLEGGAVPDIENGPRDVGEGHERVDRQALPVRVVLGNDAEEQVLVDLVRIPVVQDDVIIDFLAVGAPGEVGIRQVDAKGEFFGRLVEQARRQVGLVALVWGGRVVVNPPHRRTRPSK
jgi:hypothetical protein